MDPLLLPDAPAPAQALRRATRALPGGRVGRLAPRVAPADAREDAVALLAWHGLVRGAERAAGGDPTTAQLRAVLDEVEARTPRSAVAVLLARTVRRRSLSITRLRGPLVELDRRELVGSFETRGALLEHAERIAAPEARLLLELVGETGERELLLADALAIGLQQVRWIERLPRDVARGRLFVPVEDVARARLDILSLPERLAHASDPRVAELVRGLVAMARAQLAKGWPLAAALGALRGRALAFLLRWNAASLAAIEARGFRVPARGVPAGRLRALACLAASLGGTAAPRWPS